MTDFPLLTFSLTTQQVLGYQFAVLVKRYLYDDFKVRVLDKELVGILVMEFEK